MLSWTGRTDAQLQWKTNVALINWQNVAGTLGRSSATNSAFYRLLLD